MTKKKMALWMLPPIAILLVCLVASAGIPLSDVWIRITGKTEKAEAVWNEASAEISGSFQGEEVSTAPQATLPKEPPFEEYDIQLMAVGDNLLHEGIVKTGLQQDGSYNFDFLFRDIAPFLEKADIKAINQETIFGGDEIGLLGYPRFNSPTQVGDGIAAAGFNVVLHATNHAADQGLSGIVHCASFWEKYPQVLMAGISKEKEEESNIPLLQIGEVTFAILNYTYGPNAAVISADLRGHLKMLCDYDGQTGAINFKKLNPAVLEDIRKAEEKADVVVVFPHWGNEYAKIPSEYQRKFAQEMTEAGADLLIGTHPHVPQPVEWIAAENGNRALCYYSLGNYVSLQKQAACMLEGLAWVTFHVSEDGVSIAEDKTGVLPIVCQYKLQSYRLEGIYLLEDYTQELASRHGIQNYGEGVAIDLEAMKAQSEEAFGDMTLTRADILNP